MEILQIAGGRLKITLTREDLSEYKLDCAGLNYTDPVSKKALDAVLAVAEAKTGAALHGKQTYIQLYPSKDGGCEIFVLKRQEKKKLPVKETSPVRWEEQSGIYLCEFDDLESALLVRKHLTESGENVGLYKGEERYLLVSRAVCGTALFLEEFGRRLGVDPTPYLKEHMEII